MPRFIQAAAERIVGIVELRRDWHAACVGLAPNEGGGLVGHVSLPYG